MGNASGARKEADADGVKADVINTLPTGDPIWGLTTLDDELYILRVTKTGTDQIEIYDATTFGPLRHLSVPGLGAKPNMTVCPLNRCLYVSDWMNDAVHRVDVRQGSTAAAARWTATGRPQGLSVTSASTLLVTCFGSRQIKEYTTFGEQVRQVDLQWDVINPWMAIRVPDGSGYVVCHGEGGRRRDEFHRVVVVDDVGRVGSTYGERRGAAADGRLSVPGHMCADADGFLYVADLNNRRVLVLDRRLNRVRDAATGGSFDGVPFRVHVDDRTQTLYVVDNVWRAHKWYRGRVIAVRLNGADTQQYFM